MSSKRYEIVSLKLIREKSALYEARKIQSPSDGYDFIKHYLEDSDREKAIVCCLNTKNEPINISTISMGSINSSIVHPREVFKVAILSNAATIVLFHCHPSGNSNPSEQDYNITNRLKEAGKILGIELLDHIIVGHNEFTSMKEKGAV